MSTKKSSKCSKRSCDSSDSCCNEFNTAYGDIFSNNSEFLIAALRAAGALVVPNTTIPVPFGFYNQTEYLQRLALVIGLLNNTNAAVQSAFRQATRCCGSGDCCEGIANGILGATSALFTAEISILLNPLIPLSQLPSQIANYFVLLNSAFDHILNIAGCTYTPFVVPTVA